MKSFSKTTNPLLQLSGSQTHLHQPRYSKYLKQFYLLFSNKLFKHLVSTEAEYLWVTFSRMSHSLLITSSCNKCLKHG